MVIVFIFCALLGTISAFSPSMSTRIGGNGGFHGVRFAKMSMMSTKVRLSASQWNPCWTVGIYDAPTPTAPVVVEDESPTAEVVPPAKQEKKESKKKPAAKAKKSSPKKDKPKKAVAKGTPKTTSAIGFGSTEAPKASAKESYAPSKKPSAPAKISEKIAQAESAKVDKGLTHIKQNKYAPSSEEAADMNDEEFRMSIYKNMKDAERERKTSQKGTVGSAISDEYFESLGARN